MIRQTIDLGSVAWRFGRVARRDFSARDVYDLPAVNEWLPATVPGNVRTDLLALGRIPDPFVGEGYQESLWVEEVDWWYCCWLEPGPLAGDQRAFLVFEGIDYLSAIFVNGQERARHEGMFSRQVLEVTGALRADPAELAVRLWGSSALPRRQLTRRQRVWQAAAQTFYHSWSGVYPDRSATLKCQMSFGWDFAPPIRTMGLWDEVYLLIGGPVVILEAGASGRPVDPVQAGPGPQPAVLSIHLALDADRPCRVAIDGQLSPANFSGDSLPPFQLNLDLPAGRSRPEWRVNLPQAALWQPWERGQPHLYRLRLALAGADGTNLDETTCRAGVCAIGREGWRFTANGRPLFIRGLNWVPADSFPGRLDPARYAPLLHLARQAGANLLRVWGGGLREKQAFYDLCDELGLLVWQEFPFACLFLGSFPQDRPYLSRVEAECSAIVRQLRGHPSLAAWGGGNEFSQQRNRPLLRTLAAVVRQHDSQRLFIPVSPSFAQGGDRHQWDVWHGGQPLRLYQAERAAFLSEFGLQALPHQASLAAVLTDPTQGWETHHADRARLNRYLAPFLPTCSPPHSPTPLPPHPPLPTPPPLPSLILASQRAQAVALQTASEHMRRRKGDSGGLCLWQFNEPWPAISWAIVDYFGRPKLACDRLANWYRPLLVSLKFQVGRRWQAGQIFRAEMWAINDGLEPVSGARLQVTIDGVPVHSQRLDLAPDSAQVVGDLAHRLAASPRQVRLTLQAGDRLLAENSYDLDWFDSARGSLYQWLRRRLADWVLR